jgi:AcrR family transcriptional regulator
VLEAAMHCFARDGFHSTSIRDVIAESGLSAGAVYSYFPSKTALVTATVEPILEIIHNAITETLRDGAPPQQALPELLQRLFGATTGGPVDLTRIAVTAWGEALRDPEVRGLVVRVGSEVRATLTEAVRAWQGGGSLAAAADPTAAAQVLFSTIVGFLLQHALFGDVSSSYGEALGALLDRP